MTESDWSFFTASWERYAEACKLEPGEEVRHLWSACSDSLQKTLHNKGAGSEKDKVKLMDIIKQLAVKKRNNLVNVIAFQQMCQERDEGVHGFLARLNGQAELCDMTVSCPEHGCDVSFKERLTMLQLVRGLQDLSIQERVLQEAASVETGELSLAKVTKLVEAAEMSKSSQASITKAGGLVGRISEHRKAKDEAKMKKRAGGKQDGGKSAPGKSCSSCGQRSHGSGLQERRDFPCPAFDIKCRDCSKMGHFAKHCKNKSKDKSTGQVKEVKEVPETGEKDKPQSATANAVVVDDGTGDFFNVSVMAGEA